MKHIKIHVHNADPADENGFKLYPTDSTFEIDGVDVGEYLQVASVHFPLDEPAYVQMRVIPDRLDIEIGRPNVKPPAVTPIEGTLLQTEPSFDEFARAAMVGLLSRGGAIQTPDELAKNAYLIARAMMEESGHWNECLRRDEDQTTPAA